MDKQEVYRMIKEQVKIVDYASRMGFTVIRKGRYFSLKEHDSVIIDPEKNCFWRNSKLGNGNSIGKGGSIIDFLLEFTDRSLHEVLKELSKEIFVEDMAKVPSFEKSKKMISRPTGTLELPPQDSHMHNVSLNAIPCASVVMVPTRSPALARTVPSPVTISSLA